MECGILEIFKAACELNNNVTIMVELAIGVGLALFLYRMQHKSSKKQREVWESQQKRVRGELSGSLILLKGMLDEGSKSNLSVATLREDTEFVWHYRTVERIVQNDGEFLNDVVYTFSRYVVEALNGDYNLDYASKRVDTLLSQMKK